MPMNKQMEIRLLTWKKATFKFVRSLGLTRMCSITSKKPMTHTVIRKVRCVLNTTCIKKKKTKEKKWMIADSVNAFFIPNLTGIEKSPSFLSNFISWHA